MFALVMVCCFLYVKTCTCSNDLPYPQIASGQYDTEHLNDQTAEIPVDQTLMESGVIGTCCMFI